MSKLPNDSHQPHGISLATLSLQTGVRKGQLAHYCRIGRIEGARFDRSLWQWRIYPPAKLIMGRQS